MLLTSQPMGKEEHGISLDLGIASSIDPLHLTEVGFPEMEVFTEYGNISHFKIGAARLRSSACGPRNLLLCG